MKKIKFLFLLIFTIMIISCEVDDIDDQNLIPHNLVNNSSWCNLDSSDFNLFDTAMYTLKMSKCGKIYTKSMYIDFRIKKTILGIGLSYITPEDIYYPTSQGFSFVDQTHSCKINFYYKENGIWNLISSLSGLNSKSCYQYTDLFKEFNWKYNDKLSVTAQEWKIELIGSVNDLAKTNEFSISNLYFYGYDIEINTGISKYDYLNKSNIKITINNSDTTNINVGEVYSSVAKATSEITKVTNFDVTSKNNIKIYKQLTLDYYKLTYDIRIPITDDIPIGTIIELDFFASNETDSIYSKKYIKVTKHIVDDVIVGNEETSFKWECEGYPFSKEHFGLYVTSFTHYQGIRTFKLLNRNSDRIVKMNNNDYDNITNLKELKDKITDNTHIDGYDFKILYYEPQSSNYNLVFVSIVGNKYYLIKVTNAKEPDEHRTFTWIEKQSGEPYVILYGEYKAFME